MNIVHIYVHNRMMKSLRDVEAAREMSAHLWISIGGAAGGKQSAVIMTRSDGTRW